MTSAEVFCFYISSKENDLHDEKGFIKRELEDGERACRELE